jgi:predicted PilT family ATPase
LIDVLSQNSSSQNETFASTILKEIKTESNAVELLIPDHNIGAVLGPKAQTLNSIQKQCGDSVKIDVKKRSEMSPTLHEQHPGYRLIRSFFYSFV